MIENKGKKIAATILGLVCVVAVSVGFALGTDAISQGHYFWIMLWMFWVCYSFVGFLLFLMGGPWFWPWIVLWAPAMWSELVNDFCDDIAEWGDD